MSLCTANFYMIIKLNKLNKSKNKLNKFLLLNVLSVFMIHKSCRANKDDP